MASVEYTREAAAIDPRHDRPGSRRARLAEANKQLEILLEAVDLDAEPELGAALTEAVAAVEHTAGLIRADEGRPPEHTIR